MLEFVLIYGVFPASKLIYLIDFSKYLYYVTQKLDHSQIYGWVVFQDEFCFKMINLYTYNVSCVHQNLTQLSLNWVLRD